MPRYLVDAFFPLEIILKLFALGNFEYLPGQLNVYFSNSYIIIVWFLYFSCCIYLEYQKFICRDIIGFIMFNSNLFGVMSTVMSSQYYKQVCHLLVQTIELFQIFISEIYAFIYYQLDVLL